MKNLIILLFSIVLFSSCQDEQDLEPNTCTCGQVLTKMPDGAYYIKNECSGNVSKFYNIPEKDIKSEFIQRGYTTTVKYTYCFFNRKSW